MAGFNVALAGEHDFMRPIFLASSFLSALRKINLMLCSRVCLTVVVVVVVVVVVGVLICQHRSVWYPHTYILGNPTSAINQTVPDVAVEVSHLLLIHIVNKECEP